MLTEPGPNGIDRSVAAAYGDRAQEYVDAVGRMDHVHPADIDLVTSWSRGIDGSMLDVGCGPGQWTAHLSGIGVEVEGIDPAPEFIALARSSYPWARYRPGHAEDLGIADGSAGGILAWYSLIHLEPLQMDAALAAFARGLRSGGGLALGFFTAAALTPFDHAVATAYYWPVDALADKLESAGFTVTHTQTRTERPARDHAALLAERRT